MKRTIMILAAVALLAIMVAPVYAQCSSGACPATMSKADGKAPQSAVCPVMGAKIPDVSKAAAKSVYKGETYYFCCSACKPVFDKDPDQYIKAMKSGKFVAQANCPECCKDCPMKNGEQCAACCKDCPMKNGEQCAAACKQCPVKEGKECPMKAGKPCPANCDSCGCPMAAKASAKATSAVCPVMGTKIADTSKATAKSVYKNETYYFCCSECMPKFDKDPEKYIQISKSK